jgi:hypothetical protein
MRPAQKPSLSSPRYAVDSTRPIFASLAAQNHMFLGNYRKCASPPVRCHLPPDFLQPRFWPTSKQLIGSVNAYRVTRDISQLFERDFSTASTGGYPSPLFGVQLARQLPETLGSLMTPDRRNPSGQKVGADLIADDTCNSGGKERS